MSRKFFLMSSALVASAATLQAGAAPVTVVDLGTDPGKLGVENFTFGGGTVAFTADAAQFIDPGITGGVAFDVGGSPFSGVSLDLTGAETSQLFLVAQLGTDPVPGSGNFQVVLNDGAIDETFIFETTSFNDAGFATVGSTAPGSGAPLTLGETALDLSNIVFVQVQSDFFAGPNNVILDEFFVEIVPEPGAAALIGLGGLALLRRRRAVTA